MHRLLPALLAVTLCGCQMALPAQRQAFQATDDMLMPEDPNILRDYRVTNLRATLPRTPTPEQLAGIEVVNLKTGQRVPLSMRDFDAERRELSVYLDDWGKYFTFDSDYELRFPKGSGLPAFRFHTERPPYRLRWEKTAPPTATENAALASITNAGDAFAAGAITLSVVCDQVRGKESQTVYFASLAEAFGAGETRQVRLPLELKHDFQPKPWTDVGYTECRNEYVKGLGQRRATFDR